VDRNHSSEVSPRALAGIAIGRKSWLFAGSDRRGGRAAIHTLIAIAKLNGVDQQA
jgi:transposase